MACANRTLRILLIAVLALGAAVLWGCHGAGLESFATDTYRIDGALILDRNTDSTVVVASLTRNDSVVTGGTVRFDGSPLGFFSTALDVDSVYYLRQHPAALWAGGEEYLFLADASRYRDSTLFTVPDTFSITQNFTPANHLLQGPGQIAFEWTGAAGAAGYVVAAVKQGLAYTGAGYSDYAATGVTAGGIPAEAFINPVSLDADTGLYNVYVYAFTGVPDSALSAPFLPVPIPDQQPDNVKLKEGAGRFGMVSIIRHDTVRVAEQ
jgi:hypothetical protein